VGINKKRRCVRVSQVSPDLDFVPFNHKLSTLERAVKERVFNVKDNSAPSGFAPPPKPAPGYFGLKLGGFKASLRTHLVPTAPWNHQEFVDSYKGRKLVVYTEALKELYEGYNNLEKDASVHVFIKNEKTDRTTKSDPVPRVISPRNPKYNLRVGRYLKKIEHRVFKSLGTLFGHPTVMKGYDIHATARLLREKWDMLNDPVAVGIDASRFDQHVSIDALKFEHSVYLDCFKYKKDRFKLSRLLKYQLRNRCVGYTPDGMLKYTTEGTRMSGDMNTSLGNCVLMCGMIWTYLEERKVNGHLANNGDDCVIFMERKDLARFSTGLGEWFLKLGFNMVVEEPVDEFEKLEFCQTKPIFDGEAYVMVRNPVTAIAKDSVMLNPFQGASQFKGWLDAVGSGGLAMTGGIPVFQAFYACYVRSGEKRVVPDHLLSWNMQQHLLKGVTRKFKEVTPEARASFWSAFDITPDEQVELEKYYDGLLIRSDLGDYQPRSVFSHVW
jgi:hypothetical protein